MRPPLIACLLLAANAPAEPARPLAALGQAAAVREYRVPAGPAESFRARQLATISHVVDEVLAARGAPMLRETVNVESTVRLIYPDALVTVSSFYSTAVICRIDLPTRALGGLPVEAVTALAARSCRASEERSWGAEGPTRPWTIGAATLPGAPGVTMRIVAASEPDPLFDTLIRVTAVERHTSVDLVRGRDADEYGWRDTPVVWRYAWFADATMLAVGYRPGAPVGNGQRGVGLACAVTGPAAALAALDSGPAARWCGEQVARLTPGLPRFVAAVNDYRRLHPPPEPAPGDGPVVISSGTGFQDGVVPTALVEQYWRTGDVAEPSTP